MNNRNAWLAVLCLLGWLALLLTGVDFYKPEVTNGIFNYVASLDTDARIEFVGWILSLVVSLTLACYFLAKSRKKADNASATE